MHGWVDSAPGEKQRHNNDNAVVLAASVCFETRGIPYLLSLFRKVPFFPSLIACVLILCFFSTFIVFQSISYDTVYLTTSAEIDTLSSGKFRLSATSSVSVVDAVKPSLHKPINTDVHFPPNDIYTDLQIL
jgi:hypothetical protein